MRDNKTEESKRIQHLSNNAMWYVYLKQK